MGGATAQLTFFSAISAWGGEFPTAAIIPIVLKNFPEHRGIAVASAKCLNGVGGALVAQFYTGFLAPDTTSVILVGAFTALLGIVTIPWMTVAADARAPPDRENTNARFARVLGMEFLLCVVSLGASLANNFDTSGHSLAEQRQLARAMALLVLGTMALVFASPLLCGWGLRHAQPRAEQADLSDVLFSPAPRPERPAEVGGAAGEDVPLRTALCTVNFWLYIFCLFVCFGGGNYVSANVAQMVQALGEPASRIPFLITIMSLASGLSRVLVGATAHRFERAGVPRTAYVLCSSACMLGSQLLLATSSQAGLYLGAVLGQFGYGACYAYHPTIMSDLYGLAHVGSLYKVASWTDAWGMFALGKLLAQHFYESAIPQGVGSASASAGGGGEGGGTTCYGAACFRPTALVTAALAALALASALVLVCRTRAHYRLLWPPRQPRVQ